MGLFPGTLIPRTLEALPMVAASVAQVPAICVSTQDNNGVIGLLEPMKTSSIPVLLQLNAPVIKIVSGEQGPGVRVGQAGARRLSNP